MIKAVIFDLDGVIVSTDEYHYLAWKALADRLGLPFDRARNNLCRGVSRMESLDIVLGDQKDAYTQAEKLRFAQEKNEDYREYLELMSPDLVPKDVLEALDTLKKEGYLLAIGSSSKNARLILENVELTQRFDAISDGTNISHSKPDPEVFLKAAQMLGVAPQNCAIVEDAEAGIQAGIAAGMMTFAIGDAKKCGKASCCIDSLAQIPALLRK